MSSIHKRNDDLKSSNIVDYKIIIRPLRRWLPKFMLYIKNIALNKEMYCIITIIDLLEII